MPAAVVTRSLAEQPHHDGSALHVAVEAPEPGATVPVFVRVPHGDGVTGLWVRTTPDAEPHYDPGRVDRTTASDTWWRCDVRMHNRLMNYRFLLDGGPRGYRWLNGTGTHAHDVTDASDFRLSAYPAPPAWAGDAVVYEIFPDRFARSTGADERPLPAWARPADWDDPVIPRGDDTPRQLYGGDLEGIIDHLDHIGSLGVNTVYLTPFFPAESNHRYNASSFHEVDPLLGGDKALVRLAQEVHARGWRLIGDLTTNHCGDSHPWFRRALEDPGSPERDFFYFASADDNTYVGWLGHRTLPKFRYRSEELRRRLLNGPGSVAGRWLAPPYDLDGWRIDVANMTGRHVEDDFNASVARDLRRTAAEGDRLLIAEHCYDASGDLAGDGWHGAMNYAGFTRPVWSWLRDPDHRPSLPGTPVDVPRLGADALLLAVRAVHAAVPWRATVASWSLLGSHDSARIRTVCQDADVVEVAAGLLFTMPGVPMVFAGDEIGLEGALGEDSRRPFPWHRPERWDRITLTRFRALGELRRAHHALRRGGLRWIHAETDRLVYLRESEHERLLVLAVRAACGPLALPAAGLGLAGAADNIYGGGGPLAAEKDDLLTLPGDGPTFQVWRMA